MKSANSLIPINFKFAKLLKNRGEEIHQHDIFAIFENIHRFRTILPVEPCQMVGTIYRSIPQGK